MKVYDRGTAQKTADGLYEVLNRRIGSAPTGNCPVDITASFVRLCLAQSCGKCVPCRVGLDKLYTLLEMVLDRKATAQDLETIRTTAEVIRDSADCAIGYEAARFVLDGFDAFRDDYMSHIEKGVCTAEFAAVSCIDGCPAHVNIPGYIALTQAGRYADAVRLIRNDNPFPSVCGLICEHPCELHCRRGIVDDPINIRGIKRFAVEHAGKVDAPECAEPAGKSVAVIGGGPAGLTAAYFLRLKGYDVTVFERRKKLGGMLRYGIPIYRLPDADLDYDIDNILSTGVQVRCGVDIGTDLKLEDLRKEFDAVYISIGAHAGSRLRIEGEDAEGVMPAVKLLGDIGDGNFPSFTGKNVVIVGGGNVAMDATRSSMRLGAASVKCVYRRRIADMTALPEEVEGAMQEGCEIIQLMAPVRVQTEDGHVTGLVVKPQLSGPVEGGRPKPVSADLDEVVIPCDIIVVAAGQSIESGPFEEEGVPANRGRFRTDSCSAVPGVPGVFAGGDAVSGPATAIRAVDAGKVAADTIDRYFGNHTPVRCEIDIPTASYRTKPAWGRVNMKEESPETRRHSFGLMEQPMTDEEAVQECSRCLRCDHYGCAAFKGGKVNEW